MPTRSKKRLGTPSFGQALVGRLRHGRCNTHELLDVNPERVADRRKYSPARIGGSSALDTGEVGRMNARLAGKALDAQALGAFVAQLAYRGSDLGSGWRRHGGGAFRGRLDLTIEYIL